LVSGFIIFSVRQIQAIATVVSARVQLVNNNFLPGVIAVPLSHQTQQNKKL
jgi:hypothetical protein